MFEEDLKPLTIGDIDIVKKDENSTFEDVAVVFNARLAEDVIMVKNFAKENNLPYYVAIKKATDGTEKFFAVNEKEEVIVINKGEFGVNSDYAAPTEDACEEETIKEETIDEETIDEEIIDENSNEVVTEISEAEIETQEDVYNYEKSFEQVEEEHKKLSEYDAMKEEIEYLKLKTSELEKENAVLKDENDLLELNKTDVLVKHETSIEDVVVFLKENSLTSITIKED